MDTDDPIGRAVINVSELQAGVEFDSWIELRRSPILDDAGEFGALRMRYRVEWRSERRRMLSYLYSAPEYIIPLPLAMEKPAAFTIHGIGAHDEDFSLEVLLDHAHELKEYLLGALYGLMEAVEALIYYERPLRSVGAGLLWQVRASLSLSVRVSVRVSVAPASASASG